MLHQANYKHAPWFILIANDKDATHIALITHLLARVKYHHKDEKLLAHNYVLVDTATGEIIKDKLY